MADSNLSREQLAERLGYQHVSSLIYDAYGELCDNWDDDVIDDLSDTELKEVLGLVAKHFDWEEYYDQIGRQLKSAIRDVMGNRAVK
jgi:hypothetical protein